MGLAQARDGRCHTSCPSGCKWQRFTHLCVRHWNTCRQHKFAIVQETPLRTFIAVIDNPLKNHVIVIDMTRRIVFDSLHPKLVLDVNPDIAMHQIWQQNVT